MTREEAIEIIESNCSCTDSKLREACAMFIPKLKESEDERIRKIICLALIASEDELSDFYKVHNICRKDCTDWLERQKEQKYYWKPTDKQMKVLFKANPVNLMPDELRVYYSLCNDLKKYSYVL